MTFAKIRDHIFRKPNIKNLLYKKIANKFDRFELSQDQLKEMLDHQIPVQQSIPSRLNLGVQFRQ